VSSLVIETKQERPTNIPRDAGQITRPVAKGNIMNSFALQWFTPATLASTWLLQFDVSKPCVPQHAVAWRHSTFCIFLCHDWRTR